MAFFGWVDEPTTNLDLIALKERFHEAICASIKAQRIAGNAAASAAFAEEAYTLACRRVRELELELKEAKL